MWLGNGTPLPQNVTKIMGKSSISQWWTNSSKPRLTFPGQSSISNMFTDFTMDFAIKQ
jgi:hypothetical protein